MDLRCSGVEVKVFEIGNTEVKYSTWVNVFSYFTPLYSTNEYTIKTIKTKQRLMETDYILLF